MKIPSLLLLLPLLSAAPAFADGGYDGSVQNRHGEKAQTVETERKPFPTSRVYCTNPSNCAAAHARAAIERNTKTQVAEQAARPQEKQVVKQASKSQPRRRVRKWSFGYQ